MDLHVSPETLLAILRQALVDSPYGIEVLVRFRAGSTHRSSCQGECGHCQTNLAPW